MSSRNSASVLQEGPMVQMIFALRGDASGGHFAEALVEPSLISVDIVPG
jgi:hypothetical protein